MCVQEVQARAILDTLPQASFECIAQHATAAMNLEKAL